MRAVPVLKWPSSGRPFLASLAAVGLSAVVATTLAGPAQAMPSRFHEVGTIVACDGEGGYLEAGNATMTPPSWIAWLSTGDGEALASGDGALLVDGELSGTFPAADAEGKPLGDLTIDGTIEWGSPEVVSEWIREGDGVRYRAEGTRTPLSGAVTLSLGDVSTTLTCTGWDFDLETFMLAWGPAADRQSGWWQDTYELDGGAGTIGFYGDRQNELGVALDFVDPYSFAGERLQVRDGAVEGTLLLRDPETFEVVGLTTVSGTVTQTGSAQIVEAGPGYEYVTDRVYYDVTLTITTETGEWTDTWPATHETIRSRAVFPPKAI